MTTKYERIVGKELTDLLAAEKKASDITLAIFGEEKQLEKDLYVQASEYASKLSKAWGFNTKITVSSDEITEDATRVMSEVKSAMYEEYKSEIDRLQKDVKSLEDAGKNEAANILRKYVKNLSELYDNVEKLSEDLSETPFYFKGTAVVQKNDVIFNIGNTPIIKVLYDYHEAKRKSIVNRLKSFASLLIDDIYDTPPRYLSLLSALYENEYEGFESEVGHLLLGKLTSDRTDSGIHEAADMCSILFYLKGERIPNVISKCSFTLNNKEIKEVMKRIVDDKVSDCRTYVDFVDAVREGKELPKKACKLNPKEIAQDFLLTRHYEGIKLFLYLYDACKGDLDKAVGKFGELIRTVDISNYAQALGYAKTGKKAAAEGKDIVSVEERFALYHKMSELDVLKFVKQYQH